MTCIPSRKFSGQTSSLLVDPVDLSRNVTKILMEAAGCHVSACEDFEQAAGLFGDPASETDNTFDLVVIDSRTLDKHFAVLRAMRSTCKVMPITISIIPEARAVGIFDLFEAGSKVVVTHPYQPQQFINILGAALRPRG